MIPYFPWCVGDGPSNPPLPYPSRCLRGHRRFKPTTMSLVSYPPSRFCFLRGPFAPIFMFYLRYLFDLQLARLVAPLL